jgi:hypothetical protein
MKNIANLKLLTMLIAHGRKNAKADEKAADFPRPPGK